MPTFFFHVHGDLQASDTEGTELPDDVAAKQMAIRSSAEALRDFSEAWQTLNWVVTMEDAFGRKVLTLRIDGSVEEN